MPPDCPLQSEAGSYLAGELSRSEREVFELHLNECEACRAEVTALRDVYSQLYAAPAVPLQRDLSAAILMQVRDLEREEPSLALAPVPGGAAVSAGVRRRGMWWSRVASAAAVLMVAIGTGVTIHHAMKPSPSGAVASSGTSGPGSGSANEEQTLTPELQAEENASSVARALDWFRYHQEPDGSWNVEKWGGIQRYEVALTALPLIALLEGDLNTDLTLTADRATLYLVHQQNLDGTFGKYFRDAPHMQSVCTLALLHAYQHRQDPALHRAIDLAMQVIYHTQTPQGGWRGSPHSPDPDVATTLWHQDVLELAAKLGWTEASSSLDRTRQWLAAQPVQEGLMSGNADEALTDYQRAYFTVSTLRKQKTTESLHRLAAIRHHLVHDQRTMGEESGTWSSPDDPSGRAGGTIYSTAMAVLTLR